MKKLVVLLFALLMVTPLWAEINFEPLLNKVSLQLRAEQWVTTKTALVDVSVNAAVTDQGIEKIQSDVMQKLNQLADKADWHILSFNRQQDKSGLESIQIMAQARLLQTQLAGLRDKAKAISKPGETLTIEDVQFTPSEDEQKQANSLLRAMLYQQAKTEIDVLNKTYPDQKFSLHTIDFISLPPMQPMPSENNMLMAKTSMLRSVATPLSVGNKVQLQAMVVLAAMPDVVAKQIAK